MGKTIDLYTASDLGRPLLFGAAGGVWKRIRDRVDRFLLSEKWSVGIVKAPIWTFLNPSFSPVVHWLDQCGHLEFLADGFGVIDGGKRFVLAERFSYRGFSHLISDRRKTRIGRGHITSIALDDVGEVVGEEPAIDIGVHMSYPCTVRDGDAWFLIAEECSRNKVNLYQRQSNGAWQYAKELLPHALVDATVFHYAGRWWMFGTTCENPLSELHIWFADELQGHWEPHPGNPVRCDPRNSRPGGTPFLVGEDLYRPTQNCTKTYGGSIVINRIETLTGNSFSEHSVQEVLPFSASPYQDGLHTMAAFGDWTLIDAKRNTLLPRVVLTKLRRKLTGL